MFMNIFYILKVNDIILKNIIVALKAKMSLLYYIILLKFKQKRNIQTVLLKNVAFSVKPLFLPGYDFLSHNI